MYTIDKSKKMNSAWNYLHRHLFILYYTYIATYSFYLYSIVFSDRRFAFPLLFCDWLLPSVLIGWYSELQCLVSPDRQMDSSCVMPVSWSVLWKHLQFSVSLSISCPCVSPQYQSSSDMQVTLAGCGVVWCGGNGILTQGSRHGGCCW